MATVIERWASLENKSVQLQVEYDDATLEVAALRLVNTSGRSARVTVISTGRVRTLDNLLVASGTNQRVALPAPRRWTLDDRSAPEIACNLALA